MRVIQNVLNHVILSSSMAEHSAVNRRVVGRVLPEEPIKSTT
jgi:hypothetical protein